MFLTQTVLTDPEGMKEMAKEAFVRAFAHISQKEVIICIFAGTLFLVMFRPILRDIIWLVTNFISNLFKKEKNNE